MKITRFYCRRFDTMSNMPKTFNLTIYGGGSTPKLFIDVSTSNPILQQRLKNVNEDTQYKLVRDIIDDLENRHQEEKEREKQLSLNQNKE